MTGLTGVNRRPLPSWRTAIRALQDFLLDPHWTDDAVLRLIGAVLLAAGGLFFFRGAALPALIAVLISGAVVLTVIWIIFHVLGIRSVDMVWPGTVRALTTALLLFCVLPPGIPVAVIIPLALLAVLVEGAMRQAALPLALGGVLLVWPLAWAWQAHFGVPYLSPFDLHHLDEPVRLWTRFQVSVDPIRLYAGNVAGPLGATSFGLAMIAVILLGYARKLSWLYLAGVAVPIALTTLLSHAPLTVYLLSGPAMVFAGILGADMRRLPHHQGWRLGAGLFAGAVAALLINRGAGSEAYGAGVLASATALSMLQLFGPAGARTTATDHAVGRVIGGDRFSLGGRLVVQLGALLLFQPLGLVLVARDDEMKLTRRGAIVAAGVMFFVAAGVGALYWAWVWRLPG